MANPTSAAAMMPNVQHGTTWRHAAIGEQGGHLRQRTILGDRLSGDTMTRIQRTDEVRPWRRTPPRAPNSSEPFETLIANWLRSCV
jgi:hypothetical protein